MNKQNGSEIYIQCKDYTVSGEEFKLIHDPVYDMLITTPQPKLEDLARYYESEDYISHTDSKRTIVDKVYQLIKKHAIAKKVALITKLNGKSGRLLDIGAGTGDFLLGAKKSGWSVKGVEPNLQARKLASEKNIELAIDTTSYGIEKFDVITMWHVLEHVPDLQDQIKELKRLIKPGGYIIIAVPNYKSFDAMHYGSFWAAYDVPRHLWHFSKTTIQKLFREHGIILKQTLPMVFDSFYVALLSEKYKKGKIKMISAFFIGLRSNWKGYQSKEFSSHIYVLKNE